MTNIVEQVVRGYFASRAVPSPLPSGFCTNIPGDVARSLIGPINPGVGYWWIQIDGQWFLSVPTPEQVNAFWPVFVVTTIVGFALVFLWDYRKAKLSGAS